MRFSRVMVATGLVLAVFTMSSTGAAARDKLAGFKAQCASYGFREGGDGFADCVMKLSLRDRRDNPDGEMRLRQYREASMARRGDDRYPVCSAAMMDNELDTTLNKWVGPNCQMAPD